MFGYKKKEMHGGGKRNEVGVKTFGTYYFGVFEHTILSFV